MEWHSQREGISLDDVHLQALSSSELRPRMQTQSVVKQSCLGRSLSLFEVFLRRRRDLFLRLLLLFTGVLCEFPCEFLPRILRRSAKNSWMNNANHPTCRV